MSVERSITEEYFYFYLFIYFRRKVKNRCERRCLGKFLKCVRELSHQLPKSGVSCKRILGKESRGARNKKVMKGFGGGRKDLGFLITR